MGMSDCVFCKIVAGEIPSYKIYEDEKYLAFLDITQVNDGHTLLITKEHIRWVWDIPQKGEFFEIAAKIAHKMQEVTGEESVVSLTIGEMVEHVHYHLLPKTEGELGKVLERWTEALSARTKSPEEMAKIQERFRL